MPRRKSIAERWNEYFDDGDELDIWWVVGKVTGMDDTDNDVEQVRIQFKDRSQLYVFKRSNGTVGISFL